MDGINAQIDSYLDPLIQRIILFLPKLAAAIVIFLFTLWIAAFVARMIEGAAKRRQVDSETLLLLTRLGRWGTILFGVLWALETVDGNITGFLAGLGLVGFTIGFALQDIAKNFVAGIMLLVQQPFNVGDVIAVAGFEGTIEHIYVRATAIRTIDGLYVLIPNADVYINPITNYTKASRRRLRLQVGVAYGSDLEQVTRVALDAIRQAPGVLAIEPWQPQVVFQGFGGSSIDLTLFYWIDVAEISFLAAQDQGVKRIDAAFAQAGIEIPYPVVTIKGLDRPGEGAIGG
ncbi:MAG: mechanosensitive ion channel [Caldilineales bacterium]|nr:mechanosensitive ion channel [Caldilineales bacterium]